MAGIFYTPYFDDDHGDIVITPAIIGKVYQVAARLNGFVAVRQLQDFVGCRLVA